MALSRERIQMTHRREELREFLGMRTVASRMNEKKKMINPVLGAEAQASTLVAEVVPTEAIVSTSTEERSGIGATFPDLDSIRPTATESRRKRRSRSTTTNRITGTTSQEKEQVVVPEPEPLPANFDAIVDGERIGGADNGRMFVDRPEIETDEVERVDYNRAHREDDIINPPVDSVPVVVYQDRNHNHVAEGVIVGGSILLAAIIGYTAITSREPGQFITTLPNTPTSSAAAGSKGPDASPIASAAAGTKGPDASPTSSAEVVTSSEDAARIFGVSDWAKNPENWTKYKETGWILKANPDGTSSIIKTPGNSVAQAWWKEQNVNGVHKAIGLAIGPNQEVPVTSVTVYTNDSDANKAYEGQLALERITQPGVFVGDVCKSAIATGDKLAIEEDGWTAEQVSAEYAASHYGVKGDGWSDNPENWIQSADGGMVLKLVPGGKFAEIRVPEDGIAQAYVDINPIKGEQHNKVLALTLGGNVDMIVRQATIYKGVPAGEQQKALVNAFNKAVNYEIDTQNGVRVVALCRADQAGTLVFTVKKSTAIPAKITEATTRWYNNILAEVSRDRLTFLSDGGVKIKPGKVTAIKINSGEFITYWNGSQTVTVNGPTTIKTGEATIYSGHAKEASSSTNPGQKDWRLPFEKSIGEKRAHPLAGFSNGLKIELGPKVGVTIAKGERIDTPTGSFYGPWTGDVTIGTIWKLN
jgi:hypothetical protein